MPHLTVFGMHYAPEATGNAPYTTSLAEHAARSGWRVTVHTGYPHYPQWERRDAPAAEDRNGVSVRRHPHSVPSQPTALGRGAMDLTWAATVAPDAVRRGGTDVVMGVVPNLTGAWAARTAARRSGAPFALWFQDLMGQAASQSGTSGGSRVAGAVRRVELAAARRADAAIVAADGFRPYLETGGVDPQGIHVVRNWSLIDPPTSPKEDARRALGLPADARLAVHSGNMGAKQGLDVVLDAAASAPEVTWVLQGDGSERRRLADAAAARSLDNVVFLPTLDAEALADLLAAADVLVLTQRDSVTDMSLPSKLTTYATAGRPIVASVNPASEAAGLITAGDLGAAVPAGDGVALAAAVRSAPDDAGDHDTERLFGSPDDVLDILAGLAVRAGVDGR